MKKALLISSLIGLTSLGFSQENKMPISGHDTITTCSGTITDDGGSTGNHSLEADGYLTIYPSDANKIIKLTIPEDKYDVWYGELTYYFGDAITDKSLSFEDNITDWDPITAYGDINSGAITLRFETGRFSPNKGFEMNIECLDTYPAFDLEAVSYNAPDTVIKDRNFSSGGRIENNTAFASNPYDVTHYISTDKILDKNTDFSHFTQNVEPEIANGFVDLSTGIEKIPLSINAGKYYIFRCLDAKGISPEANENNNCLMDSIIVRDKENSLNAISAEVEIDTLQTEGTLNLTYTAKNDGELDIDESDVKIFISNSTLLADSLTSAYGTFPQINQSNQKSNAASVDFSSLSLADGKYYAIVLFDPNNELNEPNRDNNIAIDSFYVKASIAHDFNIIDAQEDTLYANSSQVFSLNYGVQNNAKRNLSDLKVNFKLSTMAGDLMNLDTTLRMITPLEQADFTYPLDFSGTTIPNGIYQLTITLDPENDKLESASDNVSNLIFYISDTINAPAILVPTQGSESVTSCAATIADNGDIDGNYDASTGSLIITPTGNDKLLKIVLSEFDVNWGDKITFYEGSINDNNIITSYDWFSSNTTSPVQTSVAGEPIIISFNASASSKPGFQGTLTCTNPPSGDLITSPKTGELNVTTCEAFVVDPGGASGDYPSNTNAKVNISPKLSEGKKLKIEFTQAITEQGWDFIKIYENDVEVKSIDGDESGYSYIASSDEAVLTIELTSDFGTNDAGYQAVVTCETILSNLDNHETTHKAIYPNPVQNVLNIDPQYIENEIAIYSLEGQEIENFTKTGTTLDLSALQTGVYIIKLSNSQETISVKFTKE